MADVQDNTMLELGLSGYRRGRVGEKGLGLSQLGLSFARGGRARASRVRSLECKWGFGSSGLLLRGVCNIACGKDFCAPVRDWVARMLSAATPRSSSSMPTTGPAVRTAAARGSHE